MDRRDTVRIFRDRLEEVIERSGLSRSAFAGRIGVDRSTLAQILSPANERLPRAETLSAIATDQQVSADWLLGLSQGGPLTASVINQPLEIEPGAHSPADERLTRWHAEVAGYKVRYVPTTLPDLLKTEAVIRYEYRNYGEPIPESRLQAAMERLATQRRPESDMEVCCSRQSLESFARGEGVWRELDVEARREQISTMIYLIDELYPTFRWFLYDGVQRYSAPLTIFGPKRAAIYVGHMYFVFNSTEHIRVLTQHFDELIRAAAVQPPEVTTLLRRLLEELDGRPAAADQEGLHV
ncbi:helix-turn-helix domain-containing protein [Rhodospirillaceae bacterium SYSU D60014]|uniref:helix-turn-helix domain-containing protein n=1 Tax=Virgifigura deserti TaxID=2268457 RepID=UPI000E65FE9F